MTADKQRMWHELWTAGLAAGVLLTAFILVFILPMFAAQVNSETLLRFPAGFYLAAQGAVLILVAVVFWAAGRQETIDRKLGAAEEN